MKRLSQMVRHRLTFIGLILTSDVVVKDVGAQSNVETMNSIIADLEKGEMIKQGLCNEHSP